MIESKMMFSDEGDRDSRRSNTMDNAKEYEDFEVTTFTLPSGSKKPLIKM